MFFDCGQRGDCARLKSMSSWLHERIRHFEEEEEEALRVKKQEDEKRAALAREKLAEEAREEAKNAEDVARWKAFSEYQATGAKQCRESGEKEACLALLRFVRENGKHPFLDKAKEDLSVGYPKLEAQLDEDGWAKLDKQSCKAPKKSSDCDELRAHFHAFKSCKHKDLIAEIVQASEKKIEAIRRREAALEAAEAAKAAAEARQACKKACSYHCSFAVHYAVCLNVCVEAQCD